MTSHTIGGKKFGSGGHGHHTLFFRRRFLPRFFAENSNAQRDEFNFLDFDEKWYPIQLWGLQLNVPIFDSTDCRAKPVILCNIGTSLRFVLI